MGKGAKRRSGFTLHQWPLMFLIDSNIIIYSYYSHPHLRELIIRENSFISEISRIEVLGYHLLTNDEEIYFNDIFSVAPILIPDKAIYNEALNLRKKYNLKLGDAIIAATAKVNNLSLFTRNLKDFEKIKNLKCENPVT